MVKTCFAYVFPRGIIYYNQDHTTANKVDIINMDFLLVFSHVLTNLGILSWQSVNMPLAARLYFVNLHIEPANQTHKI